MQKVYEQQDNSQFGTTLREERQPMPSATPLGNFTEKILQALQRIQATTDATLEHCYQIGEERLRLRFANAQMVALLTPALAHLAVPNLRQPATSPPLTVYLWDSASTGVPLPALPPSLQKASQHQQLWGVHAYTATHHAFLQPAHRVLSIFDQTRNVAIFWTEDAKQLPIYEGGAPLLLILHWWLGQQKRQIVHGAAVGTAAGAVLLVGKGGSGKSTTALRCLEDGLLYVGDDYCLLGMAEQPVVYSLYSSGKIQRADLAHFPRLQQALTTTPYAYADKQLYFFHEQCSGQIARQLPMRAVLIPTISGEQATRLSAASPAEALVAVAPSTTFQLPGAHTQTIRQLSQVLRQVPCYRLDLGTDLTQIAPVIRQLLDNDRSK